MKGFFTFHPQAVSWNIEVVHRHPFGCGLVACVECPSFGGSVKIGYQQG